MSQNVARSSGELFRDDLGQRSGVCWSTAWRTERGGEGCSQEGPQLKTEHGLRFDRHMGKGALGFL